VTNPRPNMNGWYCSAASQEPDQPEAELQASLARVRLVRRQLAAGRLAN